MTAFTSLYGVSDLIIGESRQLMTATAHHTILVFADKPINDCVVILEGSIDGEYWTAIGTVQFGTGSQESIKTIPPVSHLVKWVRARLSTLVWEEIGSDPPRITASIASQDGV